MTVRFAIVGAGKVGSALAKLLSQAGYELIGVASRTLSSAGAAREMAGTGLATTAAAEVTRGAELTFLTVPDDAIEALCRRLAVEGAFAEGAVVAHCSGALASGVLSPARSCGAWIGSLHPMQSFATAEQAVRLLPGSSCCVEGDAEALPILRQAGRDLGTSVFTIEAESKPLYHAAACVASNYLVALQNAALKLSRAAGVGREDAVRALTPLVRGTVDNLESVGLPDCLTGPVARGDVETVRRHLKAIEERLPQLLDLYKVLGRETVEVALDKGSLQEEAAAQIRRLLA